MKGFRLLSASVRHHIYELKHLVSREYLFSGADFVLLPVIFAITDPSPGLLAVIGARTTGFLGSTSTAAGIIFLIVRLCAAAFTDFDFSTGPAFFEKAFPPSGLRTKGFFLSTDFFADAFAEVFFEAAAFFTAAFFTGVFFFAAAFFCAMKPSSKIFINCSNMKRQK